MCSLLPNTAFTRLLQPVSPSNPQQPLGNHSGIYTFFSGDCSYQEFNSLWMFVTETLFTLCCVKIDVTSSCASRLEQAKEDESKDALKDLVNLVTCLCTYGVTELKPAGLTTGAPFLLPGFVLPQPSGKGTLGATVAHH